MILAYLVFSSTSISFGGMAHNSFPANKPIFSQLPSLQFKPLPDVTNSPKLSNSYPLFFRITYTVCNTKFAGNVIDREHAVQCVSNLKNDFDVVVAVVVVVVLDAELLSKFPQDWKNVLRFKKLCN